MFGDFGRPIIDDIKENVDTFGKRQAFPDNNFYGNAPSLVASYNYDEYPPKYLNSIHDNDSATKEIPAKKEGVPEADYKKYNPNEMDFEKRTKNKDGSFTYEKRVVRFRETSSNDSKASPEDKSGESSSSESQSDESQSDESQSSESQSSESQSVESPKDVPSFFDDLRNKFDSF